MPIFEDDFGGSGFTFGTSPPNRPFIAEGSDLFQAVMEDLRQDAKSKLCGAVVDVVSRNSKGSSSANEDNYTRRYLCKRCLSDLALCRCSQDNSRTSIHRVQWVDELYDKPLAVEHTLTELPSGRLSPANHTSDSVKPILKHKANCIIIVAE